MPEFDVLKYEHASPRNRLRGPAWRWERAGRIATGETPFSSRRDDAAVRKAARFRRAFDAAQTTLAVARLADRDPGTFYAYRLWRAVDRDTRGAALRYAVEARIMARESDAAIAARTGLHVDDVAAYASLFFDVRDRLGNVDFVTTTIIGPAVHRGLNTRDYDLLWKLFGYMRGPRVLDAMITTFVDPPGDVDARGVAAAIDGSQAFDVARQAAYAAKSMRITVETQADVVGLYHRLKEIERAAGRGAESESAIMTHVAAFLATTTYAVGSPADDGAGVAGEPERAVTMGRGGESPTSDADDAEFAALAFPVPTPA